MPIRHTLATCSLLTALVHSGWSQAGTDGQNPPGNLKQLSLEELGNVEVTSFSKDPQQVQQTPAAIFVITSEDIQRSGATSIPEALRLAPGVDVARIDGNSWTVSIRGFAGQFSKSLLVLVDGRSVYTPLFEGVYWDLPYVMLEDVDRIEVIRGPGGTIWGANAVNGVVNIITKSATNTHGGLATLGGGTVDQGTGALRYGNPAASGVGYRIYSMGEIRGQESHPDGDGFDHSRMGQMGFHTDWKRGQKDTFTVQGDIYGGKSGERTFIPSLSPPAELTEQGQDHVSGGNLLARWQPVGNRSDIQIQTYLDRTNRQNFELGETRTTFDIDFVHHLQVYPGHELIWGLGVRVSPSRVIQTVQGISFLPANQTDSIYSGFAQYELPIVRNRLTATAGTKLEHNNFSGYEYQPSARLLWSPTSTQSVWVAATRAVRTPSRLDQDVSFDIFDELFPLGPQKTPIPVYFQIQGNPKLKSEHLVGQEFGYRNQVNHNLYVDIDSFYNEYNRLQGYGAAGLQVVGTPPSALYFLLPYGNVIKGHTIGMEVAPNWRLTDWLQVRGSYSYLHMTLKDKAGYTDVGNLLSTYYGSSPQSVGNFQFVLNLPKRLELDPTYRYSGALHQFKAAAYSTADLRVAWNWREGLGFSLVGQNLLQRAHPEFGGDPGPLVGIKRSIYAKLTWQK